MKPRFVLVSAALLSTLSVLACSGGGDARNDDAGTPPNDGGGGGDGGGDGGDAGTIDDSGPSAPAKGGGVYLTSYDYKASGNPVTGMSASAAFFDGTSPAKCSVATAGNCTVTDCSAGVLGDAGTDAAAPNPVTAGHISVSGGTTPVSLDPVGTAYTAVSAQTTLWSGGEEMHAVADGADVPAFDVKLVAPSYITVTSPTFPAPGGKLQVVRSQGLDLTWSGGAFGQVRVTIYASSGAQQDITVACDFPAADGAGTLPPSLLNQLPGGSTAAGAITVQTISVTDALVSGWGVRFFATTQGKTSTDALASVQISVQ